MICGHHHIGKVVALKVPARTVMVSLPKYSIVVPWEHASAGPVAPRWSSDVSRLL